MPALIEDPFFYAVAVPVLLLVGISKGGFGGGMGLLGVPLLALAVPLVQAAAILLPILCLMDLFALGAYRNHFHRGHVKVLLPAALLGIAAGSLAFGAFNEAWIRLLVGSLAVAFSAQYWAGLWSRGGVPAEPAEPSRWRAVLWGAVSGFTSTIAHAGGPPLSVYLLPQRLAPTVFVGTTVVFFTAVNYVKLVPYAALGQLHLGNLATSLVLAPLAPAGIYLGRWLHVRVSVELFYRISYGLLLAVGARLCWDGARALL